MSRRKQRKPQQLISDCDNSTSSENGDTAGEEVQVCRKCCAQFDEPSDFTRHKECCPLDNQVVVIVENQAESNRKSKQASISEESRSRPSSPESFGSEKKTMVTEQCDRGTSSMASLRHEMDKKGVGPSQRFLIPNGGLIMDGMAGPKVGLAPMSQEAVPGGQTASAPINIPMILEELRVLQQRQIRQMQITEQICQQVLMLGSLSMTTLNTTTSSPERTTSTRTLPVFSPSKQSECGPESAKTFCRDETSKQTFLHLYNHIGQTFGARSIPNVKDKLMSGFGDKSIPGQASLPTSPSSQLISPHAIFPPGLPTLPAGLFLGARVLENAPSLLKQKNSDSLRGESQQERSSGKHKCRFCAKVFGSDSALQIHLRSHTGERPYKCNICGNRFTTRGNLKVHFHRHREKYPHIQMNPHPVPEHLDYVLTSTGLPYGMSVPPEKAEEETIEKKPVVPPIMATEGLNLFPSSGTQGLHSINKLVLMKADDGSGALKAPNVCAKTKSDENTPPVERTGTGGTDVTGRMQLSKLVTSLPSWALLASHFKSGNFPFSYTVEPLGYSETSKLQQLVEKIDKQATVPNQCVICLRVLSCPRALRLHYNQHGGERPFKCKICGRAFSTKGNLKAHFVGHKSSLSSKPQNSCPICQKKFTNAVTLQQHIRMHLGGQIPNGDIPHGGSSKTDSIEEKTTPDFSDEISTDEDSLDASESESEKAALRESEISSMDDDAAASAVKKNNENSSSPPATVQHVPFTAIEVVTPSETSITTTPAAEAALKKETSDPLRKEDDKTEIDQSSENATIQVQNDTESKQEPETDMSDMPEGSPSKEEAHTCDLCCEKLPSMESLGEHMKCHTKDGLFHCLVCKQSFLEASILTKHVLHAHQVHMSTHVWNNSTSRRGRRLSLDNLGPLLSGTPVRLQDFLSRDIPTQLVGVSPLSFWNQYTAYLTSGPPPSNVNITSTAAVISPPLSIGLQTAKVEHIPTGALIEVKEKKSSGTEALCGSRVKEEK
ncbi:sal-like protein 2 isoform X2 [Pseudophryne corroboree]|uniref:sal-like protein 2 isoform X2 n=1 Tax=Pseudophryne corroboree TaxID=495146 RepID=UPI0030812595